MSTDYGIDVKELDSPENSDYSHLDERIIEESNDALNKQQRLITFRDNQPANLINDQYFDDSDQLFNKQLILFKKLKFVIRVQNKKNYFARKGENANKLQIQRCIRCIDGDDYITIKFANQWKFSRNFNNFYLEIALVTVSLNDQYYYHINKLQLNLADVNTIDENPVLIRVTPTELITGKISFKLDIVKTPLSDLTRIASLASFNTTQPLNCSEICHSVADLQNTFSLSRSKLAFSLGYITANHQFIRLPMTTVMSNELVENKMIQSFRSHAFDAFSYAETKAEKALPKYVTCPSCLHCFNIQEMSSNNEKHSASSTSDAMNEVASKRNKTSQ